MIEKEWQRPLKNVVMQASYTARVDARKSVVLDRIAASASAFVYVRKLSTLDAKAALELATANVLEEIEVGGKRAYRLKGSV